jgi:hypothetical protein
MHATAMLRPKRIRRIGRLPAQCSDPTPERMAKAGQDFTVGSGEARVITMADSPFARALSRGVITPRQYEAGRKYAHHWYHAGLSDALGTFDPNRVFAADVSGFCGMAKTEAQAFHRQRYRAACAVIGMTSEWVLTDLACRDKTLAGIGVRLGWNNERQATAAATERARIALDLLCDLWSI